jgi:hypothetical protein
VLSGICSGPMAVEGSPNVVISREHHAVGICWDFDMLPAYSSSETGQLLNAEVYTVAQKIRKWLRCKGHPNV